MNTKQTPALLQCVVLFACLIPSTAQAKDLSGTLSYFKDFDFSGKTRIIEIDGSNVVAQATLNYHSRPAGVHDGDGGTMLHLKIASPDQIKEGTYTLNQSIFQARVAEWASPHGYQVFSNITGTLRVRKYVKFHQLYADLDLRYGPEPNRVYRGPILFENHNFSRRLNGKIDWNSFDANSIRTRSGIRAEDISGNWSAVDMLQESNGVVYGMIDKSIEIHRSLDVKGDTLLRSASGTREKFTIRDGIIDVALPKDQNMRTVTGIINQIGTDSLTVTWIEKWNYDGKDFSSTHRLMYKRLP